MGEHGSDSDAESAEIDAQYSETDGERRLSFRYAGREASIAQNIDGYAMVAVRDERGERERYYGFDMALDHAAELLGVDPNALPVPEQAADMGM